MIYIDSNEKLASLLEKIVFGNVSAQTRSDVGDLISELRSSRGEVNLYTDDQLRREIKRYVIRNKIFDTPFE